MNYTFTFSNEKAATQFYTSIWNSCNNARINRKDIEYNSKLELWEVDIALTCEYCFGGNCDGIK